MDWVDVLWRFAVPVVTALVGYKLGQRRESQQRVVTVADRDLADRLERLQQTRQRLHAEMNYYLMAASSGRQAAAPLFRFSAEHYPKADPLLLGDADALVAFQTVTIELQEFMESGRRDPKLQLRAAEALVAVDAALAEQERRARAGEPVLRPAADPRITNLYQRATVILLGKSLAEETSEGSAPTRRG